MTVNELLAELTRLGAHVTRTKHGIVAVLPDPDNDSDLPDEPHSCGVEEGCEDCQAKIYTAEWQEKSFGRVIRTSYVEPPKHPSRKKGARHESV